MDQVTKGQQPFATLVGAQLAVQPARKVHGENEASRTRRLRFAPLEGRKVLVFSDSRQKAAGLSIDLNSFAARDAVRPLLARGWSELLTRWDLEEEPLHLGYAKAALLLGEARLATHLRAPIETVEASAAKELENLREEWVQLLAR
jgi:hypothetical protein